MKSSRIYFKKTVLSTSRKGNKLVGVRNSQSLCESSVILLFCSLIQISCGGGMFWHHGSHEPRKLHLTRQNGIWFWSWNDGLLYCLCFRSEVWSSARLSSHLKVRRKWQPEREFFRWRAGVTYIRTSRRPNDGKGLHYCVKWELTQRKNKRKRSEGAKEKKIFLGCTHILIIKSNLQSH